MNRKSAFTLAEVLITLGIIGVVAAMTIPTLISVNNQRAWDTAANVFERKLGESLSVMNTQNALGGWPTTEAFVSELQKHMKINKVCQNPTDCFESEIYTGDEEEALDISMITQAKNLNSTADPEWGTNVLGVQFANGVSGIVAYNPSCRNNQFSNQTVAITGSVENNGKKGNVGLSTNCISILYDVNGYGKPNKYTTGGTKADLRGINVSLKVKTCQQIGNYCISDFGTDYSPVDCSAATPGSVERELCESWNLSTSDHWIGAQKKCVDEGLKLPTQPELKAFYNTHKMQEGVPTTGRYWTTTGADFDHSGYKYFVDFSNGVSLTNTRNNHYPVLCIE